MRYQAEATTLSQISMFGLHVVYLLLLLEWVIFLPPVDKLAPHRQQVSSEEGRKKKKEAAAVRGIRTE